ncbi:MAG: recombinase family protein [Evtepia sp.]|uniref:recombinase family protein n=1 Tax=Evtepia sp. TaxID=2773933 RepID=UPI002A75B632|nr:recombinase family protein [Evtepia sp.]MDY3014597.1 recombinase family protein [Evtepia sp.]
MKTNVSNFITVPSISIKTKKLRVCAYARVSTDKDDQANSYESQVRYFTEYIKQHSDWIFAGIYADEGISGTNTKKRHEFNRMIVDAENGLIDLILTKEVSRFARNTVDTLSITRSLKKKGIYVIFVNDNINTADGDGELRLSIMATIAQDESRKTSERVKWGQKRQMEKGVVFGRDMLGYKVEGGKLYLNEKEAEIVKLIFHKFTNEGKGTHVIARELREAGISPMRVKEWSNTVILRVLRNEKYVGDLCQKKTYTPDYLSHDKKYNRGAEEKVYIKDHHPEIAIIDRDLWDRTQAELERRSPSPEQKAKHSNRYWCSGKLICGECGGHFTSRTQHLKNGTIYKAWRCWESSKHGLPKLDPYGNNVGCVGRSIGDRTLRYLTAYAINMISVNRDSIVAQLTQIIKEVLAETPQAPSKEKIEKQIENLQKKKMHIIDLAAEGLISKTDLKEQNALYTAQIDELTVKLADAESAAVVSNGQAKQLEQYIKRIKELTHVEDDNEQILHNALKKAIVYNDGYVDMYLNIIPFCVRIWYKTSGKMDYFKVEVTNTEIINSDVQF